MDKTNILGISFNNVTLSQAINISENYLSSRSKHYIVTPNPEFVTHSIKDKEFREILNKADLSLPDGVGIVWASKLLGPKIVARVTGADFVNNLLNQGVQKGYTFFFLGGKGDVAKRAVEQVVAIHPGLKIGYFAGEPGEEFEVEIKKQIESFVKRAGAVDFLLVAFGHGKQEKWVARNLDKLPVKVAIGVGGVLDYLSLNKILIYLHYY